MIRGIVALAAIAASGAGCKRRLHDDQHEVLAAMQTFANKMCACNPGDTACAQKVQDDVARWGTDQAKRADKASRLDEASTKQITAVMEQYSKCMATAMGAEPRPLDSHVSDEELPPPPPAGKPVAIDAQLRVIRDSTARLHRGVVLAQLEIQYARADGTLDPEYGKLQLYFTRPPAAPADDPQRPLGAPVPAPSKDSLTFDCPQWTLQKYAWVRSLMPCMGGTRLTFPRCSVAQVWARAIADQAPKGALASLTLHEASDGPQSWQFAISDPPRNVDFQKTYPDDCEPIVEQPPK